MSKSNKLSYQTKTRPLLRTLS